MILYSEMPDDYEFVAGQVVRLRSGGPDMTIASIDKHGVEVNYYNDGQICVGILNSCTLNLRVAVPDHNGGI